MRVVNIAGCRNRAPHDGHSNFPAALNTLHRSAMARLTSAAGSWELTRVSASSITTHSPLAWDTPWCSAHTFPTQPSGSGAPAITVAPASRATLAVASSEQSSTTITSTTAGAPANERRHSGRRDASLRAGITTLIVGTLPLASTSGGLRRAARTIIRRAAMPAINWATTLNQSPPITQAT